jgi:hypothetical protein
MDKNEIQINEKQKQKQKNPNDHFVLAFSASPHRAKHL